MLNIAVDFDPLLEGVEICQKQIPFALALTLTKCAQQGQQAAIQEEGAVFKLRNDWTQRNTKITPATKQTLAAEVYTDTGNRKSGAPDYLQGQEDGRERVPLNGRQYIAIPTRHLRQWIGEKPIPDWLRPKALLRYVELDGKYVSRRGKLMRSPAVTRGYVFFLDTLKSGTRVIMARSANEPRDAAPMYVLVTHATIRKRLHLQEDVQKVVDTEMSANFTRALAEMGVNDALRGTGVRLTL